MKIKIKLILVRVWFKFVVITWNALHHRVPCAEGFNRNHYSPFFFEKNHPRTFYVE